MHCALWKFERCVGDCGTGIQSWLHRKQFLYCGGQAAPQCQCFGQAARRVQSIQHFGGIISSVWRWACSSYVRLSFQLVELVHSLLNDAPIRNENGQLVWKVGSLSTNSNACPLKATWMLDSSAATCLGSIRPAVAAQFTCDGSLLSGLEFDLLSFGYRISLYKQKIETGA